MDIHTSQDAHDYMQRAARLLLSMRFRLTPDLPFGPSYVGYRHIYEGGATTADQLETCRKLRDLVARHALLHRLQAQLQPSQSEVVCETEMYEKTTKEGVLFEEAEFLFSLAIERFERIVSVH